MHSVDLITPSWLIAPGYDPDRTQRADGAGSGNVDSTINASIVHVMDGATTVDHSIERWSRVKRRWKSRSG